MFGQDAVHGEINGMLRHLLQGTLGYCGFQVLQPFYAYHIPYISDEDRKRWLEDYRSFLGAVETLPHIPMPTLANFDDVLRPLTKPFNC